MSDAPAPIAFAAPAGLPRLLALLPGSGTRRTLAEHRILMPPPPRPGSRPRADLVEEVARSGLRGRGGASFPTGVKLRAVAAARRRPVVVVNGVESEPASAKDATLAAGAPHLVLDGAIGAAAAVGADRVFVCLGPAAGASAGALRAALAERVGGEASGLQIAVVQAPSGYVVSEERALVHWLNDGDARPTTGPRPFERGVAGRPTLVINMETAAHIAQVLAFGAAWFRTVGTGEEPGSALVTVTGQVERPGVYEVAIGAPLADLLSAAGPAGPVRAVLVGGYFGTWLDAASAAAANLDNRRLGEDGASLGAGVIGVLGEGACGVRETERILDWLAGQSAGQCGPCVHGLAAIAGGLGRLRRGEAGDHASRLVRFADQVEGRGACRLPDGGVRLVRSALAAFPDDVERHRAGAACPGLRRPPVLPVPTVAGAAR